METPEDTDFMNIVIVGHVDHGKSTVIGRLLADTHSLPEGKLEQVKAMCARNSRPFEYAFLLDALKDEQAQGITIDTARCFFKTAKRHYIIIDAPGHVEFLKNMVTGAARAEAALLVIDAHEGIRENSKRHGYIVSMLGIKQVVVLVNKMDLVDYSEETFRGIESDYTSFLDELNIKPLRFIPVSAREGDNIAALAPTTMPWYDELPVLGQLDSFAKQETQADLPLRFPVQDIYKFTEQGDDRRIVVGTVNTGTIRVGDDVVFLPSQKTGRVATIEAFNVDSQTEAAAGEAVGVTLETEIYVRPGELMAKQSEPQPAVGTRLKANIFWMGRAPMIKGKTYKLKLAAARAPVNLVEIVSVLDASELSSVQNKQQIDRHDVAECILETPKPIAFDLIADIEFTGRLVIIDNYEIAGGAIVLEAVQDDQSILKDHIREREFAWDHGDINPEERAGVYQHRSKLIVITGADDAGKRRVAVALERRLFDDNFKAFYLGSSTVSQALDTDIVAEHEARVDHIRRLGELARIMTASGQILITTLSDVDDYDVEALQLLNAPNEIMVINVGDNRFTQFEPDLCLEAEPDNDEAVAKIYEQLQARAVIMEYFI